MGSSNSKSTHSHHWTNVFPTTNYTRFASFSRPKSFLSSCAPKYDSTANQPLSSKRRLCLKRKVLILGLDGVGKTDLFRRLVSADKQNLKIDALPRPTLGYNVETIKIRSHQVCHRQYEKVTLWDCGGVESAQSLWPYHYSNTSLLLWLINIHDRERLDENLHLLSQVLTSPILYQVPVLIVLYNSSFDKYREGKSDDERKENFLTNLEVAFRFLATLSTSRASTFKWQVINVSFEEENASNDLKKIRQCFRELMDL